MSRCHIRLHPADCSLRSNIHATWLRVRRSGDTDSNVGATLNLFRGVGLESMTNFSTKKLVSCLLWMEIERERERESLSGGRKRKIVSFVDPERGLRQGKDVAERYSKENE